MQPDFHEHLRRQIGFLARSSAAFDAGYSDEAVRIATTIRVLIHNTSSSISLLKHLNATTISLMSSCEGASPTARLYTGLGVQQIKNEGGAMEATYAPLLDGPVKHYVPVSKWWDMIVYVLGSGSRLSRRKIVLSAANKDGGAHVDSSLTPEYEALAHDGSVGYVVFSRGGKTNEHPVTEAHFVALRQMAYELLNSPDLLRLAQAAQRIMYGLQMLHGAVRIEDRRAPPENRLEKLKGDRKGQWSIRINDQWRLCFRFEDGNAFDAEIVDYH